MQAQAAMPSVFISYRQTDDAQKRRVRLFAEQLRERGIQVVLDQFFLDKHPAGPNEGWDVWSSQQALESARVLIIGTRAWFDCFEKKQPPGVGLGAVCEADDIRHRLYEGGGLNGDVRVVLFDEQDAIHIPAKLKRYHRFHAQRDLASIVRWLEGSFPAGEEAREAKTGRTEPGTAPPPAPSRPLPAAALLEGALGTLAEIDRCLVEDKDTRTASAQLREWKKQVAAILGSEEIYGIEADDDRKGSGPYGELRNVIKKCRRFLGGLL
jgi:hypothetical protein